MIDPFGSLVHAGAALLLLVLPALEDDFALRRSEHLEQDSGALLARLISARLLTGGLTDGMETFGLRFGRS